MASDAVSAASPHYGKMVILAKEKELIMLKLNGYSNHGGIPSLKETVSPAVGSLWWSHGIANFTGINSILSERNYQPALELAERNKKLINDYRDDVNDYRNSLHKIGKGVSETREMYWKIREKIDRDTNLMSWNDKEEQYNFMQTVASFNPQSLPPEAQKLFDSVKGHMTAYHEKNGLPIDEEKFQNSVMALTALGRSQGMTNATLFSVQRGQYLIGELNPHLNRVGMHINESASIPAVESLNQIQQTAQQDEQQKQIAQTQTRGMSLS